MKRQKLLILLPSLLLTYFVGEMVVKYLFFIQPQTSSELQNTNHQSFFWSFVVLFSIFQFFYIIVVIRYQNLRLAYRFLYVILTAEIIVLKLLIDRYTLLLFASLL